MIEQPTVLILGAGTIGQLILSFALALGAKKVFISEPIQAKRDMAIKQGASTALDPSSAEFMREAA